MNESLQDLCGMLTEAQDDLLEHLQRLLDHDKAPVDEQSSQKSRNLLSGLARQVFKRLQSRLKGRKERIANLDSEKVELKKQIEEMDKDFASAQTYMDTVLSSSSSAPVSISSEKLEQATSKISALMKDLEKERSERCHAENQVKAQDRKLQRARAAKCAAESSIAKQEEALEQKQATILFLEEHIVSLESDDLIVKLQNPLQNDKTYDVKFRYSLQKLSFANNIPAYRLGDIVIGILALLTGEEGRKQEGRKHWGEN
jgi:chromosome segregation ATPase